MGGKVKDIDEYYIGNLLVFLSSQIVWVIKYYLSVNLWRS